MKLFMQFASIIIGFAALVALFVAGVSAITYYPWANDCKDAGNSVQEYGYGIPMVTSNFVCVDGTGNIVAVL